MSLGDRRVPGTVWMLSALVFVVGTDKDLIVGVLDDIAGDLTVSDAAAGQLATVFAVCYAVGAPVIAVLAGQVDRRRSLVTATVVFAAGNALSAVAPSFGVLMAARIVAAAGAAAFTPSAIAVTAQLSAEAVRGRALAVVTAGFSMASVVGVPAGTFIAAALDWRASFAMVTALAVLGGAGMLAALPRIPATATITGRERLRALGNRRVTGILAVSALAQCAGFMVLLYLGPLLAATAGVDGTQLAGVLVVFGVAGLAGTAIAGRSADRFAPTRVLAAALGWIIATLLILTVIAQTVLGAYLAVALWSLGAWMVAVPQQLRLLRLDARVATVAVSLNSSAMYLGSAVAGGVGGIVVATAGVGSVPLWAAGVAGLALLVLAVGGHDRARRPRPVTP